MIRGIYQWRTLEFVDSRHRDGLPFGSRSSVFFATLSSNSRAFRLLSDAVSPLAIPIRFHYQGRRKSITEGVVQIVESLRVL